VPDVGSCATTQEAVAMTANIHTVMRIRVGPKARITCSVPVLAILSDVPDFQCLRSRVERTLDPIKLLIG
jgi:hypothetical protein